MRQRCHIYSESYGGLRPMLGMDAQPCGGANVCNRRYAAGYQEAGIAANANITPSYTFDERPCANLNVSLATDGDLYCCVPALPPANSSYYYGAAPGAPRDSSNPDYGFTSFDNVLFAWLIVYRAITMEDWNVSMQLIYDAFGAVAGVGYMLVLVLAAGWLASNLALAVIYEQVHVNNVRQRKLQEAEEEAEREAALAAATAEAEAGPAKEPSPSLDSSSKGGGDAAYPAMNGNSTPFTPAIRMAAVRDETNLEDIDVGSSQPNGDAAHDSPDLALSPASATPADQVNVDVSLADVEGKPQSRGGLHHKISDACASLVAKQNFGSFFTVMITLNTLTQCLAYADMPLGLCRTLDTFSLLFTVVFVIEMSIKLIGLGPRGYVKDRMNLFDGGIVTVDVVALIIEIASGADIIATSQCKGSGISPSIFRTLRLIRLLTRIPSQALKELLEIVALCLPTTAALCILFVLFLYTGTLLGMAYFGSKFDRCQQCEPLPLPLDLPLPFGSIPPRTSDSYGRQISAFGIGVEPQRQLLGQALTSLCECDAELHVCLPASITAPYLNGGLMGSKGGLANGCFASSPVVNFDSFGDALLATFQIFTGEEWAYTMFLSMRNVNVFTFLFFTLALILGRYVLLNMYTAVILSCLATQRNKLAKKDNASGGSIMDVGNELKSVLTKYAGETVTAAAGAAVGAASATVSAATTTIVKAADTVVHAADTILPSSLSRWMGSARTTRARPTSFAAAYLSTWHRRQRA